MTANTCTVSILIRFDLVQHIRRLPICDSEFLNRSLRRQNFSCSEWTIRIWEQGKEPEEVEKLWYKSIVSGNQDGQ